MQKGFLPQVRIGKGRRPGSEEGKHCQAGRQAGRQAGPQKEDSGVVDGRADLRKGNAARARAMLDVVIDDDVSHDDERRERRRRRRRREC